MFLLTTHHIHSTLYCCSYP